MKFAVVSSILLAGAGLVSANVAVEEPTRNALTNLRFGHAMAPKEAARAPNASPLPKMILITSTTYTTQSPGGKKHGCGGGRFRSKVIALANAFRKTFGMELLPEAPVHYGHMHHHHHKGSHDGMVHALPFIGAGTPTHDFVDLERVPINHAHHFHHGHHRHSFNDRLNRALMSLGPWEGGAVAFVLGCGIGVLLRMFFVLIIVAFRGFKCSRSTELGYIQIDAEEIVIPSPQYTDEKVEAITAQV
jgi:hypothetical protein